MKLGRGYTQHLYGKGTINVSFIENVVKIGIIVKSSDIGKEITISSGYIKETEDTTIKEKSTVKIGKTGMLEYSCEDNSHFDESKGEESTYIEDDASELIPNTEGYKIYITEISSSENFNFYQIDYVVDNGDENY